MNIFFGKARKLDVKLVILTQILNIGFHNIGYGAAAGGESGEPEHVVKKVVYKIIIENTWY